ncbi:MAG: PQQ-dependent sugar dehydrogenase [Acidobacteria bacterium]|nr:PQQ-dependent sugar dehydrogenase [Acidobacteriota bacterium]
MGRLWMLLLPGMSLLHAQETPLGTVKGLKTAPGLEITLWAWEPMLVNPTNIDIDAKGRIWVLEAVNYRRKLKNQPDYAPAGDRILILEDTNGDGKADRRTVFDQSPELRSPLGISVLGDKVIVSQSPDIIVYTKDENDKVVKKEVLLTGWSGTDHDHGVHAVIFGHDGRYYWDAGDQGFDVKDKEGRRWVSSREGPFYAGTVLSMNPDGSDFRVLAHNFRNPYEVAMDSFGSLWQTDNDDDGNAWTRLNYVMPGGNYGYWGPGGRSWRADKGTHFHSELPGVVPNIARLGAGSPCGLVVYEGNLLPEKYRGQLLHAEAGKRIIAAYHLSPDAAGYKVQVENVVSGPDTWFRPSDVAVAPDGAVYISDWYDPGVGGHNMKDIRRGRIYRLAPPGYRPRRAEPSLASPAQSARYLEYARLLREGPAALPELEAMWRNGDPVLQARALWLIGRVRGANAPQIREASVDADPRFRILAMRVWKMTGGDWTRFASDPSAAVRRELAAALQDVPAGKSAELFVQLAKSWDGQDRWYLEALGIAARGRENAFYGKLRDAFPGDWDAKLARLIWELRPSDALPYLRANLHRPDALEALAAMALPEAGRAVAGMMNSASTPDELRQDAFARMSKRLFSEWIPLRKDPAVRAAIRTGVATPALRMAALELLDDLEDPEYGPELLSVAKDSTAAGEARVIAVQALGRTRDEAYFADLDTFAASGPAQIRVAAVRAIGYARPPGYEAGLQKLLLSNAPNEVRSEAVRVLVRTDRGITRLLDLEQKGELPAEMRTLAMSAAHQSRNPAIHARAEKLLPLPATKNKKPLPPARVLLALEGNAERGKRVFSMKGGPECNNCHSLDGSKQLAGPHLTNTGGKFGKEGLLDALLNPSAAIAPEYTMWILETKTRGTVTGTLGEDTPQRVVVRTETGDQIRLKPSEITSRRASKLSMMPEDLPARLTGQQIADLLEFLTTLKQAAAAQSSPGGKSEGTNR